MSSTNPRDVAYLFRDYLRSIHAKAVANDPSFVKIAVLAGRVGHNDDVLARSQADTNYRQVEQWTESHYPSFINFGLPVPKSSEDWVEGMDVRIKQLPGRTREEIALAERRKKEQEAFGSADVSDLIRFGSSAHEANAKCTTGAVQNYCSLHW